MKRSISLNLTLLILLFCASSGAQTKQNLNTSNGTHPVEGSYQATATGPGIGAITFLLILKRENDKWVGEVRQASLPFTVRDVTVDAENRVTIVAAAGGAILTIVGRYKDNKLMGDWTLANSKGSWSATKSIAATTATGDSPMSAAKPAARATTPPITDASGKVIPESIASLEQVRLGGLDQYILIRGRNKANPILLSLHGGPGMPQMYLAHAFQRDLENYFTVVQWDRRGAGKSYSSDIPIETMTVEQMIADTIELTQHIRKRFHQPKIYLLGHSWGTYLGMLVIKHHPDLFYAYVGVGQLAYMNEKNKEVQDKFFRQCAKGTSDKKAIEEFLATGKGDRETWLFKLGAEIYKATSPQPLIETGLRSPEYESTDVPKILQGVQFSQKHMKYNAISGQLIDSVTSVAIPVYFFTGRHDYTTPFELTEQYYRRIKAPRKKMVWFKNSAHFAFFEEPERFTQEMRKVLTETFSR